MEGPAAENKVEEIHADRVELGYCERCGALCVRPPREERQACARCELVLAWLCGRRLR